MKNLVKQKRSEESWSQQNLANRLNISRQSVIAIEKGKYDPSLPLAFAIAKVFNTTIEGVFIPEE